MFHIKIAGHTARVQPLFASTRDYCARYLTEEAPELTITVTPQDLEAQQQALRAEALQEGLRPRVFTDPFLERTVIQEKLAARLLDYDTILFHGSAIAVDGAGYLFTADCGTGKSTHARLWRQLLGDRAVMVNDDKPFLQLTDGGILLHGSPWSGKHGLDTNVTVPLRGICILERGKEDRIERITPSQALPMLQKQACHALPGHIHRLSATVPLYHMTCTPTPTAAATAYAAMGDAGCPLGSKKMSVLQK